MNLVAFTEVEKELAKTGKSPIDYLTPEIGKINVVTVTREGCPACENQKPELAKLARKMKATHGARAAFTEIFVKYSRDSTGESTRSKELLGHYFYPTNLILLRTRDLGAIEVYKNIAPKMDELNRSIETAIEVAKAIEDET